MKKPKFYLENYPRPQMVKPNWQLLDGAWDFAFDDANCGEKEQWYLSFPKEKTINVPFSYHTKASGIGLIEEHNYVWYCKTINYDISSDRKRIYCILKVVIILLKFG